MGIPYPEEGGGDPGEKEEEEEEDEENGFKYSSQYRSGPIRVVPP